MAGLMIGNGEVSLIGLSMGFPLGTPLESPNPIDEMPDTLLGAPMGYGLALKQSGACVPAAAASWISMKLLFGGRYFLHPPLWSFYHI